MNILVLPGTTFPDKDDKFYGGIFVKEQVKALSKYVDEINVITPIPRSFGKLYEDRVCRDYNFDNVNVYFPRFWHLPLSYFRKKMGERMANVIEKVIQKKSIKFDLIHAHFTWPSGYAGVKLSRKFKVPLVTTFHGSDVRIPLTNYSKSFDNIFLRYAMEIVFQNSDVLITHHEELYDLVITNYPNLQSKLLFVYKGIDLNRFNPNSKLLKKKINAIRQNFGIHDNKFIVLFLSRLDEDKDPITFIKAAEILKQVKDIVFLMVGDGTLKNMLEKYKQKKKLNNVLILGPRSDTEVWYGLSDIYCALSPIENIWSTTLQEAFCMGKVCVVTKAGYTTKVLEHLKDAFLIQARNPTALAEAILILKQDEKLRKNIKKRVLQNWRPKFDINKTIQTLLGIYSNVLSK